MHAHATERPLSSDTLSGYSLQELVVSANRWAGRRDFTPVKIARLGFEESNAYNPQTAADMLGLTGEVFVQKSQYGGGSPMIRGFAANRLLYSVDGVRMNSAIFRAGNLQNVISLDPFAISSTEVLFGPGSVCYGSDAIGGVMVFNTLQPKLSPASDAVVYGSATLRTATASNEQTAHVHVGAGWRRWGFVTSLTRSGFGDLRQGSHGPADYLPPYVKTHPNPSLYGGALQASLPTNDANTPEALPIEGELSEGLRGSANLQSPSGYSQLNLMHKMRFLASPVWNMEYAFHWSKTSEYARYDRLLRMRDGKPRYARWDYGPQEWMMSHLRVEHTAPTSAYDSLHVDLAWQRFGESRIVRDYGKTLQETQSELVNAWSANVDFLKSAGDNMRFTYGTEWVYNDVVSSGVGEDVLTGAASAVVSRYPKAEWYSAGLYAQAEWYALPNLNLMAGLRYNHYLLRCDFTTVGYDVPFSPRQTSHAGSVGGSIGANWHLSPQWILRANYARGFRAPNVDDMGKLFDSVDGHVTVPNPTLRPEYADNVEVGIAKSFGTCLHLDVTAYYTHLDDAIVRRDYTFGGSSTMLYGGEECVVQALQNAAEARVWGVQASLDARFLRHGYVKANFNWQRGFEELDNGDVSPSRHAAPAFGRAACGFADGRWCVELFTAFQAECPASAMPEEEREKTEIYALDADGNAYSPHWVTLNARASYKAHEALTANLTLENITDLRYRPYSSGISAPGRNLTLSLTYDF